MKLKLHELLQIARGPENLNGQGINVAGPLQKIFYQDLPASTALDLVPLTEAVEKEVSRFEDVKKKLFEKYGEKNEENNMIEIKNENLVKFQEEINPVLEKEVELPDVKIKKTHLEDVKLSAGDVVKLKQFIEQ